MARERDVRAKASEMDSLGVKSGSQDLDMTSLKERMEMLETKDRQWGEIKMMLGVYEAQFGLKLLNSSGEPNANAWILIVVRDDLPPPHSTAAASECAPMQPLSTPEYGSSKRMRFNLQLIVLMTPLEPSLRSSRSRYPSTLLGHCPRPSPQLCDLAIPRRALG